MSDNIHNSFFYSTPEKHTYIQIYKYKRKNEKLLKKGLGGKWMKVVFLSVEGGVWRGFEPQRHVTKMYEFL